MAGKEENEEEYHHGWCCVVEGTVEMSQKDLPFSDVKPPEKVGKILIYPLCCACVVALPFLFPPR